MMWSSKDMRTGAVIFAVGFFLGAFFFSSSSQLESMRTSRETWKSKAETAQTELYSLRTNCASKKKQMESDSAAQVAQLSGDLKLKEAELDAARTALADMENIRKEEIEKLDDQLLYLKERSEEMQRKNSELTVMQQTSISSIEGFTEQNGGLLKSLLSILQTAANVGSGESSVSKADPDMELDLLPEFNANMDALLLAESEALTNGFDAEIANYDDVPVAEQADALIGFEPPPREVGNMQVHEEEFHQQLQEDLEMQMDNDEYPAEHHADGFNLENEIAGVHPDHAEEVDEDVEHIPEMQAHPIDLEEEVLKVEGEEVPGMPKLKEVEPLDVKSSGNRLLEELNEKISSKVAEESKKKKSKSKKKKRKKHKKFDV